MSVTKEKIDELLSKYHLDNTLNYFCYELRNLVGLLFEERDRLLKELWGYKKTAYETGRNKETGFLPIEYMDRIDQEVKKIMEEGK